MNTCDVCLKTFKRRDNMLRHKRNKHGTIREAKNASELTDSDASGSELEGETMDFDDASVTNRQSGSNGDGERYDPWDSVVQKAFEKYQDQYEEQVIKLKLQQGLSEVEARNRVYLDMRGVYRKALGNVLINRIEWFHAINKAPVYKALKKTATNLMAVDDYGQEEAWKSAVSQRKYLFDSILSEYYPPELEGGDQNADDAADAAAADDEASTKRFKV